MKRILSTLLTTVLLLTYIPLGAISVSAGTFNGFKYESSTSSVMIIGYTGPGGDIVIPSEIGGKPVTSIVAFYTSEDELRGPFEDCDTITSVVIPNTVAEIGDRAFYDCDSLTSIVIPNSVKSIGSEAFSECSELNYISLPDKVLSIGENAFFGSKYYENEENWEIGVLYIGKHLISAQYYYYDFSEEIPYGDIYVKEGTLTLADYAFTRESLVDNVYLPDSLLHIGAYAFNQCGITSIAIPDSITLLGDYAFNHCRKLVSIDFGNGVTTITDNAFEGCTGLTAIDFPDTITTVAGGAFIDCTGLKEITFGSGINSIGASTFENCTNLASLTIPSTVKEIGRSAFSGCTGLSSLNLGEGVTTIESRAFENCTGLITAFIPDSVTKIGQAFIDCTNLRSITLPFVGAEPTNTENPCFGYIFGASRWQLDNEEYVPASLKEVVITGSTPIPEFAFDGCENITTIVLPNGITEIGNYTFRDCSSLTSITIPQGVTTIGQYAFSNCTSLSSVTLPKSLVSIGYGTFNNCSGLLDVHYDGRQADFESLKIDYLNDWLESANWHFDNTIPPEEAFTFYEDDGKIVITNCLITIGEVTIPATINGYPVAEVSGFNRSLNAIHVDEDNLYYASVDGVLYNKDRTELILCPGGKKGVCTIPDSVVTCAEDAFSDCEFLTAIVIGSGISNITTETFNDCSRLLEITVSEQNENYCSVDGVLFNKDQTMLMKYPRSKEGNYTVPEGVITICDYAFNGCYNLSGTVVIPDSVETIGNSAFASCQRVTALDLGKGIKTIGESAFYYCWNLKTLTIPDGVISIGEGAFRNCSYLTSVSISKSVSHIGGGAFDYCQRLTTVTIDEDNENYYSENSVVFNADKTILLLYPAGKTETSYTVPDGVVTIAQDAFGGCFLQSVILPDSVITIDEGAFSNSKITSITIPNSVTTIESNAFTYCEELTSINIPNSVTRIGARAFSMCRNLSSVTIGDGILEIASQVFESTAYYKNTDNWENGVLYIGKHLIDANDSLSGSYAIKEGTLTVAAWAFSNCNSLTELIIPKSVALINGYAFMNTTRLTDVWYAGSKADRENIHIVNDYNWKLLNATWHYNYTLPCDHAWVSATCTKAKTCSICGVTSGKALGHKYTNSCDTSCNTCKATRKITHKYSAATCTAPKTCKVCGVTSGMALGHKYTNSCDTSCNTCKATRKITHKYATVTKKATTTANGYTVKRCSVCKKETGKTTIYKASSIKLAKTAYTYNGKAQKPAVTIKNSKGQKIATSNYTVTYATGRKNVGTYKVTIKFKGKYSGTKVLTFKINPVKTTVSKVTAAKKKLTINVAKKTTQVTGYEIQYATNKSFKSAKTKTLTSYKKTSLTLSGLKTKTTYYIRVRTYKTANGKKVYSGWSTIKYKKTK